MPETETNQDHNAPIAADERSKLEQLIQKNLELSQEIVEHTRKTRRYILFGQVLNIVKVVLIAGPIILAIIYLPPLIQQWFGAYAELLGGGTGQTILEGNSFVNQLFGKNFSK